MSIINDKTGQNANKPGARVGDGQADTVPTHEGSNLGTPATAKNSTGGSIIK